MFSGLIVTPTATAVYLLSLLFRFAGSVDNVILQEILLYISAMKTNQQQTATFGMKRKAINE